MVTDQEISLVLQSLFQDFSNTSNPYNSFGTSGLNTLNDVVRQLESKLGLEYLDLSQKTDFIRTQIQLLFRSHPTQQQLQPQHRLRHPQPPHPSDFLSFLAQPAPSPKQEATAVTASEQPKDSAQTKTKKRGGTGGLNKPCGVSPELQAIVGQPALPRTEIVRQLWAYIRKNNLQDPSNKRKIICNDELRIVFETDCTDMFKMNKLLAKHIIPLEPTKQSVSKKAKVEVELGANSTESSPSVIMSETLANFFGVDQREMLQSEVLRRIWEYIKVNNLEDPVNQMAVVCDAKLQEIFGCENISTMGIPEVLGRHHISRRS